MSNTMEQSYFQGGNCSSASKEIPRILRSRKIHCLVHKMTYVNGSSHHEPNNPVHTIQSYFFIMQLSYVFQVTSSLQDFWWNFCMHFSHLLRPVHLTPVDFSILTIQHLLKGANLEAPSWTYTTFSSHQLLPSPKYSPKLSVLKHH
jgi:hypothetical protein